LALPHLPGTSNQSRQQPVGRFQPEPSPFLPWQVTFIEYTFRRFSIVQMSKSVAEAIVPMQVGGGKRA
jgi:hypothetical protein